MKKTISMLSLGAILLSMLASCGGGNTEPLQTDTSHLDSSAADTTEAAFPEVTYTPQNTDYGGYAFRVLNFDNETANLWTDIPNDIASESETGDVLNDSVYRRNKETEEALNIRISVENQIHEKMANTIKQSVMSGTDEFDAVLPRMIAIPELVANHFLLDLNSIETFQFENPWWDQNSIDSLTVSGKLFTIISDISFYDKLSTTAVFFNQSLCSNLGIENLYSIVEDGKWTIDKMMELGIHASGDIDGNGKYDQNDSYGISCQKDGWYMFFHGGTLKICDTDESGKLVFRLDQEKEINALQKIFSLTHDPIQYFNRQKYDLSLYDAINMFMDNRTLFLLRPLQSLFVMRSMEADFGIIPMPKLSEEQEKYGLAVNPYIATILCVPVSVAEPERTADILEYMGYCSQKYVTPALYETVLGTKLTRDEESVQMLDLIFENRIFDPGTIWNFGNIFSALMNFNADDVSSFIEKHLSKVTKALDRFNEQILEN